MITKPNLNPKDTAGQVGTPVYADSTLTHSGSLEVTAPYLHDSVAMPDKGAKWERPGRQDSHPKADNQYQN